MKPYPVRLPEGLIADLETEADERDLSTAEYVRKILRGRHSTQEYTEHSTQEYTLSDRLDELEERLAELERHLEGHTPAPEPEPPREPEPAENPPGGRANQAHNPQGKDAETRLPEPETSDIDEILLGWEPGRSAEERDRRRAAGRAILEWVREQPEPVTRSRVLDAVYAEAALEEQNERTFWDKIALPALQTAAEAGAVRYREGHYDYLWIAD